MHDLRYHLFYLTAIFLMLGVGILFGSSQVGLDQVRRQGHSIAALRVEADKVSQERDQARDRLAKDEDVLGTLRPKLVRGKLAGQRVVLIQTGDYLDAAQAANTALADAGATVVATVALSAKWGTLTAKHRDALASVAPASDPAAQDAALLAALASAMTTGTDVGGPPAAALAAMQGQELVTVTGDLSQPCRLFVLVGGSREDGPPNTVDAPLLEGFRAVPGPVTLVGCEPLAADVSSIPTYEAAGVSTVDCVDQPLGQLALPFALRGDLGDYGLKTDGPPAAPVGFGRRAELVAAPVKVCALIPAYNEADRIATTVAALRARPGIDGIVVMDDGSTDGTADLARTAGATLVLTGRNGGKGAALGAAYAAARELADVFLLLDADLGASAGEAIKLLPPIFAGEADMTVGLLPPDPEFAASGQSGGRGLVVRMARWGIARRTGQRFRQPLSGQRAVRGAVLDALGGTFAPGFGVEVDLTVRAIAAGFRVQEVGTDFRHHVTGGDWAGVRHRARQFRDVARAALR